MFVDNILQVSIGETDVNQLIVEAIVAGMPWAKIYADVDK